MSYHDTIGAEVLELFNQYEMLYGIHDMYYSIENHRDDEYITLNVGLSPDVNKMGGGKAGKLEIRTRLLKRNLKYPEEARAYIPDIHKKFIAQLHHVARATLIHREEEESLV